MYATKRTRTEPCELDIPDTDQFDENVWETLVGERRLAIHFRTCRNWCFEIILRKGYTEEYMVEDLEQVYDRSTNIQFLTCIVYTTLNETRKASGFLRLKKPRRRWRVRTLFNHRFWGDEEEEALILLRYPRTRARTLEAFITSENHYYNFYDVNTYEFGLPDY